MFVVLNGEALVALLVHVPHTAGVIVSVIAHGVSAANPAHEATHLPIDQWSQDQMIVVGHQLAAVKFDFMDFQSFMQDAFESVKVRFLFENVRTQVATISERDTTHPLHPLGVIWVSSSNSNIPRECQIKEAW